MLVIIGLIVVTAAVVGGFVTQGGNIHILLSGEKALIIFGIAAGALIISASAKGMKGIISSLVKMFTSKTYSKGDYTEVLMMLGEIFSKIRKEGLVSIEADVDDPGGSSIFSKYPKFLKNHHAVALVTDTLRTVMTTSIQPYELDALLDTELDTCHAELMKPVKSVAYIAESFPGIGIVAAVLGIILTMEKIAEPPEVLGAAVGAALVGTMLGVLLCYGFAGPIAKNMEAIAHEERDFLAVLKVALVAFVGGAAPQIAVEFGRRAIPADTKPLFLEIEEASRQLKGK
ncbi:flagellar motor stator protein MotA [Thermodesulfovibrionales bacterium]|nr:flagellar motor stator protein MotA [Thermodesulfovibrionales bacterium]MCL0034128.1 flagellar motor stator protein MotA [Thermodesulfovibrionales bacterium]MCL0038206.1 flagellar motor stator protein MotA [Thermodesulfovibrionales bacterium]